ncbi:MULTISPECIES: serine hydrolase [Halomonadaceae]|uniref:serine hydrolase domain-containing protein n=1 Tax=Halomonadaceae TaxID=28256 RepID=UPI00159B6A6D|nr:MULTISPECIES: serine hydrolase [Halomonas]QJQ94217.1 serine hydrolase [Halomonas sp. PA5]
MRLPLMMLPCLSLVALLSLSAPGHAGDEPAETLSASATLDRSVLDAAAERAGTLERLHALVIAHDGEVVLEHHQGGAGVSQPANIKSLSKTVLAALVGIAIEQGIFKGDDQPITEPLGPLVPTRADPRVETITVGNLLSMQAGLERTSGSFYGAWVASPNWVDYVLTRPFIDEPGGEMLYSTGSSHLLSAALTQASGEDTLTLARRWLGEPLNITIPAWPRDSQGIYFGGNDMLLSPLALVRIGELYRNDGVLDGQRILPDGWVESSWQPRGRSSWTQEEYGYGWFSIELGGERVHYGRGFGGQALYVIPERGLTIAMTADPTPPSSGSYQRRLHQLVEELLLAMH